MAEHSWGNRWHKFVTLVPGTETKVHNLPYGTLRCECGATKFDRASEAREPGMTGTQESGLAGPATAASTPQDPKNTIPLPSETIPTAEEVRKADEALQKDDDARRAKVADAEAEALRARDQEGIDNSTRVKRPDEFMPKDKGTVFLPEGHPSRVEQGAEPRA